MFGWILDIWKNIFNHGTSGTHVTCFWIGKKRVGCHQLDGDDHDHMLYFQRIIFAGSYDCDVSSMFIVIGLNRKYEISLVSPRGFGTQTYPNDAKSFKICKWGPEMRQALPSSILCGNQTWFDGAFPREGNLHLVRWSQPAMFDDTRGYIPIRSQVFSQIMIFKYSPAIENCHLQWIYPLNMGVYL